MSQGERETLPEMGEASHVWNRLISRRALIRSSVAAAVAAFVGSFLPVELRPLGGRKVLAMGEDPTCEADGYWCDSCDSGDFLRWELWCNCPNSCREEQGYYVMDRLCWTIRLRWCHDCYYPYNDYQRECQIPNWPCGNPCPPPNECSSGPYGSC